MEWKDESSYSYMKGARRGEVPPSVLSISPEGMRILVHKHIYTGETWNVSCKDLGIDMISLRTEDLEEAKQTALKLIAQKLTEKINTFTVIRDSLEDNGTI